MRILADPYRIAGSFVTGPENARNGFFNDQYGLVSRNPLPEDFRFEVQQTYAADGVALVGKNKIVYSALAVSLYIEERGRMKLSARAEM
jgi:hypothetical protein